MTTPSAVEKGTVDCRPRREADDCFRSVVGLQFEVTGEAFSQLSRVEAVAAATIPNLPRIVAFGNVF